MINVIRNSGEEKNWKRTIKKTWKAAVLIQVYEKFAGLPEDREWLLDDVAGELTLRLNGGKQIFEMDINKFYRKMKEGKKFRDRMEQAEALCMKKFFENYE